MGPSTNHVTCESCINSYRDMEPEANGKYKWHCKMIEKIGLDPINIEFANKCRSYCPYEKT